MAIMSITAMKQALEALEYPGPFWPESRERAAQALRTAIEIVEMQEMFKEYGEGWESLAWELCADECGEEACTELIWDGGPIPEPWGDRWLTYEDEAKRLISLVQKHTTSRASQRQPLTEDQIDDIWNRYCDEMGEASINDAYDIARAIEAAHGITGEKK